MATLIVCPLSDDAAVPARCALAPVAATALTATAPAATAAIPNRCLSLISLLLPILRLLTCLSVLSCCRGRCRRLAVHGRDVQIGRRDPAGGLLLDLVPDDGGKWSGPQGPSHREAHEALSSRGDLHPAHDAVAVL